ncbi:hypothetical protein WDW37_10570 [Bdellovibrionota bacterium FG-1]
MLKKWFGAIRNWLKQVSEQPPTDWQGGEGNRYQDNARKRREEIQLDIRRWGSFRI